MRLLLFIVAKLELIGFIKTNQIFRYTRCIAPKRVVSLRGPSPRHCA